MNCLYSVVEISAGTIITGVDGNYGLNSNESNVKILGSIQVDGGHRKVNSVIYENNSWTVYGNASLRDDLTIEEGTSLNIPSGATLTIPAGMTLTHNGTLTNEGTITGAGNLTINGEAGGSGQQTVSGTVTKNRKQTKPDFSMEGLNRTDTSITIMTVLGQKYAINTDAGNEPDKNGTDVWQDGTGTTMTFTGLQPDTEYWIWAYKPGNAYYNDSESEILVLRTLKSGPDAPAESDVKISYTEERISFADTLEVNTSENFDGTSRANNGSITDYIKETDNTIYVRVAATTDTAASAATAVTIPARPAAPAPDIIQIQRTPSSLIIFYNGTEALEYRIKANEENFQPWQDSTSFEGLRSTDIYTIETRKKATDSAFCSFSDIWSDLRTSDPAYEITIPKTVTVGEADNDIKINSEKNFWLGTGGQVDVKVKSGLNGDGTLALARENDPSTTISSQMLVNGQKFTDLTKSVAVFYSVGYPEAVAIGFESPTPTENIPAGTYTGTVTFEISYSEP